MLPLISVIYLHYVVSYYVDLERTGNRAYNVLMQSHKEFDPNTIIGCISFASSALLEEVEELRDLF